MCLDRLLTVEEEVKYKKLVDAGVGWKVFQLEGKTLIGAYQGSDDSRPKNRWLDERDFRGNSLDTIDAYAFTYDKGWHVYLELKDAKKELKCCGESYNKLHKVKFKGVCATGMQNKAPVIVAREIIIKEEAKG